MKKVIITIIICVITFGIIILSINSKENKKEENKNISIILETEEGNLESDTFPNKNEYEYSSLVCENTSDEGKATFNEEQWKLNLSVEEKVIDGNFNCTIHFKEKTYEVKVEVQNGVLEGENTKILNYNESTTFIVSPRSGYGSPTVSCTNSQKGNISGNTLTVNNVTNDTTCTVTFKQVTAAEYLIEQKDDYNDSDIIKIVQPETIQTPVLTEYRYSGSDVDNYATFNNETWRIIGVFEVDNGSGVYEQRMKIMRNDSIGNYSWDSSVSTINSGAGINQWGETGSYTGSDLKSLLNSGLYYNRSSGTCYSGNKNTTKSCSFTTTGLTITAKNMIEDAKWYTAAVPGIHINHSGSDTYTIERGNAVGVADTGATITKTTNWIGKVGVTYLSDYAYASGNSECYSNIYLIDFSECISSNWMYDSANNLYTMTPVRYDGQDNGRIRVAYISLDGSAYNRSTYDAGAVKPNVYLKASVKITDGTGTSADPYELNL